MTVNVGRTHINLGWETLVGILAFTISTTYAITVYLNRQDEKLDKIIASQNYHARKDSIQDVKLDSIFSWHVKGVNERNIMKTDIQFLMGNVKVSRTSEGYFTEKKVNGRIVFDKVKIN